MRRASAIVAALVSSLAVASLVLAAPASAKTIDVMPGQSIQAAVDSAHPGDTVLVHPGVYHQSVQVNKNRITLLGSGASGQGTVLVPPKKQKGPLAGVGIAVLRKVNFRTGKVVRESRGVRVSGFLVRGFSSWGILEYGASNFVISHDRTVNNGDYGISGFHLHRGRFLYNTAVGSGEAGFYTGDSPRADFVTRGNTASGNTIGFLMRDASHGVVADNTAHGNCVGFVVLDTGSKGAASAWTLRRNDAYHNNRFCRADKQEGRPPISGGGIDLLGARATVVSGNRVWANRPVKPSPFAGGIVLSSGKSAGGSTETGNLIASNVAYRNRPADIEWDGHGHNTFRANKCTRSHPGGLCH